MSMLPYPSPKNPITPVTTERKMKNTVTYILNIFHEDLVLFGKLLKVGN